MSGKILLNTYMKKFIRGILSNFEYDHCLIREINLFDSDDGISTKKAEGLLKIYQNTINKGIVVNSSFVLETFKCLRYFGDNYLPLNDEAETICVLYEKDNYLFNLFNYFFRGKKVSSLNSSVFIILLNKKLGEKLNHLVPIYSYDIKALLNYSTEVSLFESYIDYLIKRSDDIAKEKKVYTEEEIIEFVRGIPLKIIKFLDIKQIRLFGSYFRGVQNKYSDIDFLIVTDSKSSDNNLTRDLIGKIFTDFFGQSVDIIAIDVNRTMNEFERCIALESKNLISYGDFL